MRKTKELRERLRKEADRRIEDGGKYGGAYLLMYINANEVKNLLDAYDEMATGIRYLEDELGIDPEERTNL